MEIVFVKEDQVPEGLIVSSERVRRIETLNIIGSFKNWVESIEERHGYFTKVYIIDVVPCESLFCDQGCKPNKPGCREKYVENNNAIYVKFAAEYTKEGKEEFVLKRRERLKIERENENK